MLSLEKYRASLRKSPNSSSDECVADDEEDDVEAEDLHRQLAAILSGGAACDVDGEGRARHFAEPARGRCERERECVCCGVDGLGALSGFWNG